MSTTYSPPSSLDGLRRRWKDGLLASDQALRELSLWEDDTAHQGDEDLDAAWDLRQEIEQAGALSPPASGIAGGEKSSAEAVEPRVEHGARAQETDRLLAQAENARRKGDLDEAIYTLAEARRLDPGYTPITQKQQELLDYADLLQDLRGNTDDTSEELVTTVRICRRLLEEDALPESDYVRTRLETTNREIERRSHDGRRSIEQGLTAIAAPGSVHDKLALCERVNRELDTLQELGAASSELEQMRLRLMGESRQLEQFDAENDDLLSQIGDLDSPGEMSAAHVASIVARLEALAKSPLAEGEPSIDAAGQQLAVKLNSYLGNRLQGAATLDQTGLREYREILELAQRGPRPLSAQQVRIYEEGLQRISQAGSPPPTGTVPAPSQKPHVANPVPYQSVARPMPRLAAPPPPPRPRQPVPPAPAATASVAAVPSPAVQPIPQQPAYARSIYTQVAPQPQPTARINPPQQAPYMAPPPVAYPPGYGPATQPSFAPLPGIQVERQRGTSGLLWAVIGGLLVLVLAGVVVVVLLATSNKGNPGSPAAVPGANTPVVTNPSGSTEAITRAVTDFYDALIGHNYVAAYALLDPAVAAQTSPEQMQANMEQLEAQRGQVNLSTLQVTNVSASGSTAQATVTYSFQDGTVARETVKLSKSGDRWLVAGVQ